MHLFAWRRSAVHDLPSIKLWVCFWRRQHMRQHNHQEKCLLSKACCCSAPLQVVFGLRQQYGAGNISMVNATAARVHGPLTIRVLVLNGTTNGSSNANTSNTTGGNHRLFCAVMPTNACNSTCGQNMQYCL
jgi:hypothetical protein